MKEQVRQRYRAGKLTLVLCSLLFSFAIAEVVVRIIAPQETVFPFTDLLKGINAPRAQVHGRHQIPGLFDVEVSFNSGRFRSRTETALRPDPGALRLAFLGDSFTFGFGSDDDETYPARVEELLEEKLAKQQQRIISIEAINAAYPGTGTGEQALWYWLWVRNFKPHVVILNVHTTDVENDFQRKVFIKTAGNRVVPIDAQRLPRYGIAHSFMRRVAASSYLYPFLCQNSHFFVLARNVLTRIIGWSGVDSEEDVFEKEPGPSFYEGLPFLIDEIRWLQERVAEENATLAVVFIPPREFIEGVQARQDPLVKRSRAILAALGAFAASTQIPFVDPTSTLRKAAQEKSLYYSVRDAHLTPRGNKVLAERVSEFLLQKIPQQIFHLADSQR
ncbi:MAG: SGNH/GDSL hydrolase family protein [Acidobacteria bacterium]|nr:SGNH/GDSL hydrolase family protein [Acidobacteriota bacterium]